MSLRWPLYDRRTQAHTQAKKEAKVKRSSTASLLLSTESNETGTFSERRKRRLCLCLARRKKTRRGVRLNRERGRAGQRLQFFVLCCVQWFHPSQLRRLALCTFFFSFQSNGCLCACSAAYTHTKIKKRNEFQTLTTLHVECVSILYLRKRSTPLF